MDRALVDISIFFAVQQLVPLTDPRVLQAVRAAYVAAFALWWLLLQDLPARVQARAAALPAGHRERRPCWLPQPKKAGGFMETLFPLPPPSAADGAAPGAPLPGVEYAASTLAEHELALAMKLRDGALMAAAQPLVFSFAMNVHVMLAIALVKLPLTALREPLVCKVFLAPLCLQLLGFVPAVVQPGGGAPDAREYGELFEAPPPVEGGEAAVAAAAAPSATVADTDEPAAPDAAPGSAGADADPADAGADAVAVAGAGAASTLRLRKSAAGAKGGSAALAAGGGAASGGKARVFNLESEEAVFGTWESHVTDTEFVGVFESLQASSPPHDINYQTVADGWSALMVVSGSVQYREHDVRRLLKAGARPELADAEGSTALHWAAFHACAFAIAAICASFRDAPAPRPAALAALLAARDAKGRSAEQVARERGNEAEAAALKEAAEWARAAGGQ